jgi:PAS domain S-box-containing protein
LQPGSPEARLIDLAYDAIFTLTLPDSIITYWNRGAEDLYGWRASEALGQKSFELLQTVHDRPRDEIVAEVVRKGRWSGGILQTRRDGTQMMVDARWALETDPTGRPMGMLEINRDVTALRATMSQLEFSNQVSAELNSSLEPEAVLGRLLTLAVAAAQATHATVARIEGEEGIVEASQDFRGPRIPIGLHWRLSVPAVLEAVRARKPTPSGPSELRYLSAELRGYIGELSYRLNVPLVMGEQVIGLLIVGRREAAFSREQQSAVERMATPAALALHNSRLFNEAVRQKEAAVRGEGQLREALEVGQELASEPELSTLLHNLLARSISMADADAGSICKLEDGELIIEEVLDTEGASVRTPRGRMTISSVMRAALQASSPIYADGGELSELFPLDVGIFGADEPGAMVLLPLSVAGEPIGLLSLFRRRPGPFADDQLQGVRQFTAVAALLLRMGRLLQEARQGEAAKREFLNLAGHELRTPLTVLKGYFSLLKDGSLGIAPDGWKHPMSVIDTELAILERLVESLLVAARVEADQLEPSVRRIDLVAEAQAAIRRAQPRIELEAARCSLEAPRETVHAMGDADQLALVLDNLIHNGLDYSVAPAEIRVKVEDGLEPRILIHDKGIGIPSDGHERVFERFVRLAPNVMATKSGSGLGLFISRSLARRMGGDVVIVESELGHGTTMAVKLSKPTTEQEAQSTSLGS